MLEDSGVAEQPVASRVVLSSTELVSYIYHKLFFPCKIKISSSNICARFELGQEHILVVLLSLINLQFIHSLQQSLATKIIISKPQIIKIKC
jgi:hypothetical protein